MRSGWPRNLGELAASTTREPEGHRHNNVRACAEAPGKRAGAKQRVTSRYRQAKATKRGEKGSEQS